jgi:hypothetical protein
MDSVIHYEAGDKVGALARLAERADGQVLFTFAPKTPLLAAMHTVGKAFPRGDRSPAIVPISEKKLRRLMRDRMPILPLATPSASRRVSTPAKPCKSPERSRLREQTASSAQRPVDQGWAALSAVCRCSNR